MKNLFCTVVFIAIIFGCTDKKETKVKNIPETEKPNALVETTDSIKENLPDSDCVFDNKPEELTKEWLKETGIQEFSWDAKNENALIVNGLDTLKAFRGGCNHLVKSIEFRTKIYQDIYDPTLLQKINDIACKFKFDNYCTKLVSNQFEKIKTEGGTFLLQFSDDDPEDNLISEGIVISKTKNSLQIAISEYYN
jgi:hypothetical protein